MRCCRRRQGGKRDSEPKRGAAGAAENECATLRDVILFFLCFVPGGPYGMGGDGTMVQRPALAGTSTRYLQKFPEEYREILENHGDFRRGNWILPPGDGTPPCPGAGGASSPGCRRPGGRVARGAPGAREAWGREHHAVQVLGVSVLAMTVNRVKLESRTYVCYCVVLPAATAAAAAAAAVAAAAVAAAAAAAAAATAAAATTTTA
eukprot:gene23312-biopygen7279